MLLLLVLNLVTADDTGVTPMWLRLLDGDVPDSMGEWGIVRAPVQRPELDHVVHEADDGHAAGPLLLQVLDVKLQVLHEPRVVLLGVAAVMVMVVVGVAAAVG